MKPKKTNQPQEDLFKSRLDQIINLRHPLVKVSKEINWRYLEEKFGELYTEDFGRPGLSTRLLVGLHYLKYTYNQSDESVVEGFIENPYWQYFCGFDYFQHDFPLDPTSLVKWRKRIKASDAERLLKETIESALRSKKLKRSDLKRVCVDTTVQEKDIAYPTDARLYYKALQLLVKAAKSRGIRLRQSYQRLSKKAFYKQSRYRHARQTKRANKEIKKLRTFLGRILRDIERKKLSPDNDLLSLLSLCKRLHEQERKDKNKLYSLHSPEVECISKGKEHKKYEFGNKVSFASTAKSNWIVGALSFHGNPYDGHTLKAALNQTQDLCNSKISDAYCDRGYRGFTKQNIKNTKIHLTGRRRSRLSKSMRKWLKRRSAIEPIIGHLKSDNRLDRNHLKGETGDTLNALFAAAGFNMRKLLRAFYVYMKNLFFNNFGTENRSLAIQSY
ncbi:MAG: IS5 family transposase [Candidatus Hodarchaeales archaeon]|jgi:IS5 family transposase